MSRETKKHYTHMSLIGIGWRYTACGCLLPQLDITVQEKRVTCKNCLRILKQKRAR